MAGLTSAKGQEDGAGAGNHGGQQSAALTYHCASPWPRITGFSCRMNTVGRCKLSDNLGGLVVFIPSPSVRPLQGMSCSPQYTLRKKVWPRCDANITPLQPCSFSPPLVWGSSILRIQIPSSLHSWRNCLNNVLTSLGLKVPVTFCDHG